jgi:arylsulfatase A-like enzyme
VFQTKALNDDYGGTHRLEGIFIARGPHIRQNHCLEQAQIMDVAPTILHILGIPIPNDMDGEVLRDIFSLDSDLATAEISLVKLEHNQAVHKPDSLLDQKVMKRLRDLGYL